jgi:hypothetical protein
MEWLLLAIVIAVCLVGAYYQLQVLANSKPGKLSRVWLGGWVFHPEYLEQGGQPYRKKLLACMAIFLLLTVAMQFFPGHSEMRMHQEPVEVQARSASASGG